MKANYSKVAYCTIFLVIVNITIYSQDNWSWLNPKPMGSSIESCGYFPGTNTVIAVGANGLIMRSTDNGSNWSHINSNLSTGFYSVSTINSTTAFIAGEGPTILKTQDAGATWTSVPTDTISRTISKIHFLDETTGYLLIENIVCFTSNGGISWTKLNFEAVNGTLASMHAISNSEIYVGKTSGEVIRCLGPYPGSSAIYTACSTSVVSIKQFAGKLIAVGYDQQINYSTDDGSSWSATTGSLDSLSFKDAAVIANDLMIAFTYSSRIVNSTDGITWNKIPTATSDGATSASGNFLGEGILLGSNGIQYNLIDAESTWSKTSTAPISSNLFSICAKDENEIYVAGASGTLMKTTNKGVDWVSIAPSNTSDITDLKLDPSNNLYFTTTYGRVYKSANAGLSWDSTAVTTRSLQEISFGVNNKTVVCGVYTSGSATVYYSTNAGANWTQGTTLPTNISYNSVCFAPATQTVYICGSSGRVSKSIDGGKTWVTKSLPGSPILNSIYFLDELTGFVVGNSGNIWKTLDSGKTWSQKGIDLTTSHLQSVRFSDANNGIIVGYGGVILKTTDGGTTWIKSAQITGNHLLSVTLIDGSTTLAAGYAGTVIKSSNAPLPVELTTFTASVRNNAVNLNWETATEIDNYGFDIERKDNNSNWTKIGFIEGHFTSNSPKYYSFSDNPSGSSKYSYRLKQIDNDGKFEYSGIVEVDLSGMLPKDIEIKNFPNPFNPETYINIKLPETAETTVELYNSTGEKIFTIYKGKLDVGTTLSLKVDGSNLPSGVYLINVSAGKYRKTHKILLMK